MGHEACDEQDTSQAIGARLRCTLLAYWRDGLSA